jgi:hypothetical protein
MRRLSNVWVQKYRNVRARKLEIQAMKSKRQTCDTLIEIAEKGPTELRFGMP